MKVTVERLPESQVQLDIAADDKEFAQAMDRAFRTVSRGLQVPGFRPGKAPRQLVERQVGHGAIVEEANRGLMDRLYRDALRQEDVQPIGDPVADITEFEPLAFRVVVPVYPTIDPGDYASVRVEPIDAAIGETDVDDMIERLRRNASEWVDVTEPRKPVEGDQVVIDLAVTENGEQFQEPVEGTTFILGESNIFDGLREQIETMDVGETKEFDLAFAEDDETVAPAIRGKALHYTATLTGLREIQLVELDDEFAKKTGSVDTVAELRSTIENDLHREKTANARTTVVNDALNKVAEQAAIEVPPVMVDESLDDEVQQLRMRLSQNRDTLENYLRANGQTMDELREEIRPDAARRLRNTLVVQEIAKRESIVVTDQDVLAEIDKVAAGSGNAEAIRGLYEQDQFRSMLRGDLFERNLTDRLIEIVTEGRGAVLNGWVAPEPTLVEATPEGTSDEAIIEADFTDAVARDPESLETSETTDATAAAGPDATTGTAAASEAPTPDGDNPEAETVDARIIDQS